MLLSRLAQMNMHIDPSDGNTFAAGIKDSDFSIFLKMFPDFSDLSVTNKNVLTNGLVRPRVQHPASTQQ